VGNAVDGVIGGAVLVLSEELKEIVKEKKRKRGRKCRNWIARRESLGASNCLFRELFNEDPKEYRKHMRMSIENSMSCYGWWKVIRIYLKQIL
jgi:hypothetical protein